MARADAGNFHQWRTAGPAPACGRLPVRRPFDAEARLAELLATGGRGDFAMAIDAQGDWHHDGQRITRRGMARLFSTTLRRAADGSYWLVTPFEAGRVEVEDVPFVVVELRAEGEGAGRTIHLRTGLDEWLRLDAGHPLVMRPPPEGCVPAPYVTVRPGLEARLARAVYYHLVELAEPAAADENQLGVWSAAYFVPLGSVDGGA